MGGGDGVLAGKLFAKTGKSELSENDGFTNDRCIETSTGLVFSAPSVFYQEFVQSLSCLVSLLFLSYCFSLLNLILNYKSEIVSLIPLMDYY